MDKTQALRSFIVFQRCHFDRGLPINNDEYVLQL